MATQAELNAMNEILYNKNQYNSAQASGNKSGQQYAAKQANQHYANLSPELSQQVRNMDAAALQSFYNNAKANLAGNLPQAPSRGGGYSGGGDFSNQPVPMQPMGGYGAMGGMDNGMMMYNNALSMMAQNEKMRQQQAEQMRQQQMSQAMAFGQQQASQNQLQIQNMINQAKTNQQNDLGALDSAYAQGKADIEDQSFQKYLQARQSMANRGLAGSGLANESDTRLMMSRDRTMADLAGGMAGQRASVNNQYGNQISNLNNQYQQAAFNPQQIMQMYGGASGN